ncbi:SusD/RagB family nutrient-binding outer membrane lipoprotein [Hymenobacter pini]|uniref:SusD/RagB family nutrient-binding outer membrane lipoprotein n=1 Tax=Hymenobacter pini TaxID=2880879 RepID=UPI001CF1F446|nr:SusD/RagB family nutrient-binding outer membrane lipoprotein [Hymenobacter pini]MCA8833065.1 SusD/RagB family nutrient-binding outer membrane lipoprotein [Hymenobacter pini]
MRFWFFRRALPITGMLVLTACTDRFADINTDPTTITTVTPDELFSRALKYGTLYDSDFEVGEHLHANLWVQYFANSKPEVNTDRYESNDQWASKFWDHFYTGYGMDLQQAIRLVQDDPTQVNRLSQARIWRAFLFQRMTDYWGDIPYTAAFGGASANTQPTYDAQAAIYTSILRELAEAAAALDDTKTENFGPADLLYANPQAVNRVTTVAAANLRWKQFANSLRLRMAMRLSEADPSLAATQVRAALAAGVMQSGPESAVMRNTGGSVRINQNPLATILGFNDCRISATLIEYLVRYRDPRLPVFAAPLAGTTSTWAGMPNGLSVTQLTLAEYNPDNFSQGGQRYQSPNNDQNLLTYAEVCFLRAEACLRGWDATGSAESWYNAGVREALLLAGVTSPAAATTYLQQPGVQYEPGRALEQIITQKWLSLFGHNGFEAFAEYRRTGFPRLRPGQSLGETNGQVPRRLRYPSIEQRLNTTAYQQAVSRQGPDLLTTPVWWDK